MLHYEGDEHHYRRKRVMADLANPGKIPFYYHKAFLKLKDITVS